MLDTSKVVAFIATKNPSAAKVFYEELLGLPLLMDDDFAIVFDANGVVLRVQKVQEHTPPAYTVLGWDVADIQVSVAQLLAKGVECERYEGLDQCKIGIWSAPGGAQIAWLKDPDGNILSLTQY